MNIKNSILLLCYLFLVVACSGCGSSDNDTPEIPTDPVVSGDVKIYTTSNDRRLDFKETAADFNKKASMSPRTITLDPSIRFQEMDGFGAAITGSTSYLLLKMPSADRTKFLKETFSPTEGMGYSYIRISIGCSDFSLSEYTCCDTPGIENFGLQSEELDYVIPVLKEILAINPSIKVLGSPWTPPKWMKVNNLTDLAPFDSWTDGQLNPKYYQDYATYFVKWVEAMKSHGINIYGITPQNEPLNRGNSASLFMGWDEQRDFVKSALGPKLADSGLDVKIYLFDHNYNYDNLDEQQNYVDKIYQDSEAAKYVAGAAFHNYGGNREELNIVHDKYPNKELIFTETSIGTWNDGKNLAIRLMDDMAEVALGTINNWCKAVIVWNLMLDSEKGPNRDGGCQTCYGAVTLDKGDYKTITRNSHYYIIGHLSSVVKPGATRIGTTGYTEAGIVYSAFDNNDGTYALVLLNNTSEEKKLTFNDGKNNFTNLIPKKSVVSYKWNK